MTVEQLFELEAALRAAAYEYARIDHTGGTNGMGAVSHRERNVARKALRMAARAYGVAVGSAEEIFDRDERGVMESAMEHTP